MEKGTNGYGMGQVTDSAPSAYIGGITVVPNTIGSYSRSSNPQGYQQVAKMNHEDKTTGSYERYTAREEFSTGEMCRARGSGQYGVKDEYKSSATVKVGNKNGYTEYHKEERVRNVSYDGSSRSNNYGGSKSVGYDHGASNHDNSVATNTNKHNNTYYDSDSDSDSDHGVNNTCTYYESDYDHGVNNTCTYYDSDSD